MKSTDNVKSAEPTPERRLVGILEEAFELPGGERLAVEAVLRAERLEGALLDKKRELKVAKAHLRDLEEALPDTDPAGKVSRPLLARVRALREEAAKLWDDNQAIVKDREQWAERNDNALADCVQMISHLERDHVSGTISVAEVHASLTHIQASLKGDPIAEAVAAFTHAKKLVLPAYDPGQDKAKDGPQVELSTLLTSAIKDFMPAAIAKQLGYNPGEFVVRARSVARAVRCVMDSWAGNDVREEVYQETVQLHTALDELAKQNASVRVGGEVARNG